MSGLTSGPPLERTAPTVALALTLALVVAGVAAAVVTLLEVPYAVLAVLAVVGSALLSLWLGIWGGIALGATAANVVAWATYLSGVLTTQSVAAVIAVGLLLLSSGGLAGLLGARMRGAPSRGEPDARPGTPGSGGAPDLRDGVTLPLVQPHVGELPALPGVDRVPVQGAPPRDRKPYRPPLGSGVSTGSNVLVVDDDVMVRELVRAGLEAEGLTVTTAGAATEALDLLRSNVPDLVISDVNMPELSGFEFVQRMREDPAASSVPLMFLTSRSDASDVITGLRLGADDYVSKPFQLPELVARVQTKLARPPVPVGQRAVDPRTGLVPETRFLEQATREVERAASTRRPGAVAVLHIDERSTVRRRLGVRGESELERALLPLLHAFAGPLDLLGRDREGRILLLLPETDTDRVRSRLSDLAERLAAERPLVLGEHLAITPVMGWVSFGGNAAGVSGRELVQRAVAAGDAASAHLDLQPVAWTPDLQPAERPETAPTAPGRRWGAVKERVRTPLQIAATYLLGVLLPFGAYLGLYLAGFDISTPAYIVVVVGLVVTAASIWTEGFLALDPDRPLRQAPAPEPPASAIIAAYLPNEAATVVETVESFLVADYPELQIILAYNTPKPLPVESLLAEIARRDPRFLPLKVEGSTSKAQNVNAALARVTGEFVGIFDADHQPVPDSFSRAWRWLSSGYDVVQGHSVVRNGDASWVARTVAVEFESIYAVSHPGRARLHGFGVFGGSNGYWRTELLRTTRMHGFMLTEDIDSSLRVVEAGGRIANDPALISRELAPTTVGQLWNQRMRWAQGWFQVSLKHLPRAWRSPHVSLRQKAGFTFLLGWREVYPWLSLQILPLLAFIAWREGGVGNLNWLITLFILTTLFTLSVGPGQVLFAYRVAAPEVRQRRAWFLSYLVIASLVYTEWKNIIARVAQIKEFAGERAWKVTPRTASAGQEEQE